MKTIWKYGLEVVDDQLLELPIEAKILTVQMQHGSPQLWVIVNPELQKEKRHIRIHGTGHRVSTVDELKYISSFQMEEGALVFHVFEVVGKWERMRLSIEVTNLVLKNEASTESA